MAWLLLALLCGAQLLLIVDVVVVNVAVPSISASLGLSAGELHLTSVTYTLVFGSLLIVAGRAGDLLGRRRLMLIGVLVFTLGSLASGLAQAGWQLFAARALQGLGGAMVSPNALALLTDLFDEGDRRNQAFGVWAAAGSGGAILGQLLGGALTELAGWRWIFLINVPIGLMILLLAARLLPERRAADRASTPLIRFDILRSAAVRTGNLVLALNAGAVTATLFFTTLYLQVGLGYSPLVVGAGFAPVTLIVLLVSPLAGRLTGRVGARRFLVLGGACAAAGMALLARAPADGSYLMDVLPGLALIALGSGLSYAPTFALGTSGVSDSEHGLASGLLGTAQELGAAIGLALLASTAVALVGGDVAGHRLGYLGACGLQVLAIGAVLASAAGMRRGAATGAPNLVEPA